MLNIFKKTKRINKVEVRFRWIDRVNQEIRVMSEDELKGLRLNEYIQILDVKAI